MFNTVEDYTTQIPKYLGGTYVGKFDCNNDCLLMLITDTSKHEYERYVSYLKNQDFQCYDVHMIKGNYYATYLYKDLFALHVYFTSSDNSTRIIIDSNMTLYKRGKDATCTKSGSTTLYQMELDYRNIDCGMCYITQCNDGSFFIIDSAHMFSTNDHMRLYKFLRSLTPAGEEIVISGWFFSHAHQDHIAKFMDFIETGFNDCKIESLYYNFPALTVKGADKWHGYDKQTMREFDELVAKHPELPIVKPHTGQRFFIRNLEFEVLFTHEDIYPYDLSCFNDSSTILLMTVDDCKVLFLGDTNTFGSNMLCKRYGTYLDSDIVQVAHHGFDGGNVEVYDYISAKIALFPTRQDKFDENLYREANKKVLELSEENYIAGNGTVAFKLPYTLGTAKVYPIAVNR